MGADSAWHVYLVSCSDDTLYTGIARDLRKRLSAHNSGAGAAYTRSRLPVRLEYVEPAADRGAALRRELEIKSMTREEKLAMVATRASLNPEAPLLTTAGFGAVHGFSTRSGGVSEGPYATLNLGSNTNDGPEAIRRNRELFAGWFGLGADRLCVLEQVHGDRVVQARPDEVQRADAQLSDDPRLLLVIGSADCLPLLFHDPVSGAVAAAHCGWRGTSAGLAVTTIAAMSESFGTRADEVEVAIGPGICQDCYQVGPEVAEPFEEPAFPSGVVRPDEEGRWRLDLRWANRHLLEEAGVPEEQIFDVSSCTSCDGGLFYSHRRDRGVTGRHWAAVRAAGAGRRKD